MKERIKLSERQRNILSFMERYIDQRGFPPTIREIGIATQIGSTSVVNYNLNKLVQAGYIERSSRASRGLRLLKPGKSGRSAASVPVPVAVASQMKRVPIVGQIVASQPVSVPDDMGQYYDEDSMIEVPPQMLHNIDAAEVFALRVKGDSMVDAMISDGDIVLFKKQDTARDGDMVAVWLDERGETTLKYFHAEGERVRLQPAHPTMEAIYVSAAHCHIQGRVLSVLRMNV